MSFKEAFYAHLSTASTVVSVVSTRVYPVGELPKDVVAPYITFAVEEVQHERHLTGGEGLARSRVSVAGWAEDYSGAAAIQGTLRALLDNYRGIIGTATIAYISALGTFMEPESDEYVPPSDASQVGMHAVSMTFVIWHPESITP